MENSSCEHVERLKQPGGGIRDYEKFLLNFCTSCPPSLKRKRKELKIRPRTKIRCQIKECQNASVSEWNMYACLHCIFFYCKEHAALHVKGQEPHHNIACTMSEGTVFCFACDDFIFDGALEGMRETVQYARCSAGGKVMDFGSVAAIIKPNVLFVESKSTIGLRGLVNLKYTCYMNCIIQVLVHTPIFVDYFLTESPELECEEKHEGKPCLMACMTEIVREFYSGEKTPLFLTKLLGKMWKNASHLGGSNQQDAHEFLTAMLEAMGRHYVATNTECMIEDIFHGTLKSIVVCKTCGTRSVTKEPFMEISLEVFNNSAISLEECLQRYTQIENLGPKHLIDCGFCRQKKECSKQLIMSKIPLILCMHFKRFQNLKRNKWKHPITFPTHINLSPYCEEVKDSLEKVNNEVPRRKIKKVGKQSVFSNRFLNSRSLRLELHFEEYFYSLYAVVSHKGSSEGGHYVSYFRNAHNTWFYCDDHVVTKVDIKQVLGCQAYMLFYHRTQLPERPQSTIPNYE